MEYKFGKPPVSKPPEEVIPQSLYEFVSSNFLSFMEDKLEPYLKYADKWFTRENNEIRENYKMNIGRINTLREMIKVKEVDPLAIFEGAFSGYDLRLWTDELKRIGILETGEF